MNANSSQRGSTDVRPPAGAPVSQCLTCTSPMMCRKRKKKSFAGGEREINGRETNPARQRKFFPLSLSERVRRGDRQRARGTVGAVHHSCQVEPQRLERWRRRSSWPCKQQFPLSETRGLEVSLSPILQWWSQVRVCSWRLFFNWPSKEK